MLPNPVMLNRKVTEMTEMVQPILMWCFSIIYAVLAIMIVLLVFQKKAPKRSLWIAVYIVFCAVLAIVLKKMTVFLMASAVGILPAVKLLKGHKSE